MRVAITADASYCPDTGAGGYGFRIHVDGKKKYDGCDHTHHALSSSNEAEMLALVVAVIYGCVHGLVLPGSDLHLNTDCQSAINAFRGLKMKLNPQEKDLVQQMKDLMKGLQITPRYHHMRGHVGNHSQEWCDRQARKEMNKSRVILRGFTMEDVVEPVSETKRLNLPWEPFDGFCGLTPEDVLGYFPGDR